MDGVIATSVGSIKFCLVNDTLEISDKIKHGWHIYVTYLYRKGIWERQSATAYKKKIVKGDVKRTEMPKEESLPIFDEIDSKLDQILTLENVMQGKIDYVLNCINDVRQEMYSELARRFDFY